MRTALLAACLAAVLAPAAAHDSWLAARDGRLVFATGDRYPLAESAPVARDVVQGRCVDGRGRTSSLRLVSTPQACWAELRELEVTLTPELVATYFTEIRPADAVRARWDAQREAGVPWVERYRKFARVELAGKEASPAVLRRLRAPVGMPLEIVIDGDAVIRTQATAGFQLLASGVPVTGQWVELVSERSRFGVWARTDAQGRITQKLPFPGQWLVRATIVDADGEGWRSRFATTAFEVW